jgi:hypothetical protein
MIKGNKTFKNQKISLLCLNCIDESEFYFINEDNNDEQDDEESLNDGDDEVEQEQEEIYNIEQSEIGTAINQNAESAVNYDKTMIKNFEDDDELNDVKMTVSIVAGFPSGKLMILFF